MKILFSIIILICIVEYHRTTSCNTSGDCTSNCDCNSCAKSNCQTQCQGCRTNCCSCCTTTTTSTTSKTPTTLTTTKPTQPTNPTTVSPSVDESNININVKNVMNTTSDVKIPIEISLKNVNNIVNLLNMTGNSNCTVKKGCNRTTTPKPVVPTTIAPLIRKITQRNPLTDEDNEDHSTIIPESATLDPTWVRIFAPEQEDPIPDGPIYAQPIPYNQLQNIYDQNPPIGVDYNQLSRVQSGYPYYGSNYNQFPGYPYGSSYPTDPMQGFQFGSWPRQQYPYDTLTG